MCRIWKHFHLQCIPLFSISNDTTMKKLLTFWVIILFCFSGKAQWNPILNENLLVKSSPGGSSFSSTTSDGKTYIGYWKNVGSPTNYELWLQILDVNGNKQLGADGIMLSNQIPMGTYTIVEKTAVDSSNNFYIGVTGTGTGSIGYVFKITPSGTSVWPNGINLGEALLPTILPLSNGDILVAYYPPSLKHTRIQRFNAMGAAVWASPTIIASDDVTKNTVPADLFELTNNECEIVFHKLGSFGTTSYLFAQKINFNGAIIWTDGPVQIANKTTAYNVKYQGVTDGNIVYYGYSSGQGGRFDGYLQRINADSTLPWGIAGVDFDTNQTYYEKDMKIAFSKGSPHIWSIANYSSTSQGENGEVVQKFDKVTGTRLLTDHGKLVFPIDNVNAMYHYGDMHLINDAPYFVVQKKEGTSALTVSLNAVLLNSNGDFAWAQNYVPMATFVASKLYTNVLKPINGQGVIVFQEKKTADVSNSIYAQKIMLPQTVMGTHDVLENNSPVQIYPNPVADIMHVNGVKDSDFNIYNTAGQLVKSGTIKQGEIDVRNLIKGNYILKVKERKEGMKFIKK